jgi:hypothetical protein
MGDASARLAKPKNTRAAFAAVLSGENGQTDPARNAS